MKLSQDIRSISYLKTHAAELIREAREGRRSIVITQSGEATAVLQDIRAYERLQDSLALLKILAMSEQSVRKGRVKPLDEAFDSVRRRARKTISQR
jgi:prevent-host-death family protein